MHGDIQSSSLNLISFDLFHFPQPLSFLYGAGKALCGNRGRTRREHPPSPKVLDEKRRAAAAARPFTRHYGLVRRKKGQADFSYLSHDGESIPLIKGIFISFHLSSLLSFGKVCRCIAWGYTITLLLYRRKIGISITRFDPENG